jgi:hypothetical protein
MLRVDASVRPPRTGRSACRRLRGLDPSADAAYAPTQKQNDLIVARLTHDLVRATLRIRKGFLVGRFPSQGLVYFLAEYGFEG